MADTAGKQTDSVIERLEKDANAYDFYAALRLLQAHFAKSPRIGKSLSYRDDPVRFAQPPHLNFAPSSIRSFTHRDGDSKPLLEAYNFGMFGPNGPLPLCLTEYALDRLNLPLNQRDPTFADFCNVFQHRMFSFLFRAWADAQKTVDFEREDDRRWTSYLGSLIGIGLDSLSDRDGVPDRAKYHFSGRLVQQNRNAEGLWSILQDFFKVPVQIKSFVGRWLRLPEGATCQLGASRESGTLGSTIIMGSAIWTVQLHFRVQLGPMSLLDYERLLPSGESFSRLRDWIQFYVGDELSWDAQLILKREEVPDMKLGSFGRLGWTTWLKTDLLKMDASDLILNPN